MEAECHALIPCSSGVWITCTIIHDRIVTALWEGGIEVERYRYLIIRGRDTCMMAGSMVALDGLVGNTRPSFSDELRCI